MNIEERAGCGGKVQYVSRADASRSKSLMGRGRRVKGSNLEVYHCKFCGFWHLGRRSNKAKHQCR